MGKDQEVAKHVVMEFPKGVRVMESPEYFRVPEKETPLQSLDSLVDATKSGALTGLYEHLKAFRSSLDTPDTTTFVVPVQHINKALESLFLTATYTRDFEFLEDASLLPDLACTVWCRLAIQLRHLLLQELPFSEKGKERLPGSYGYLTEEGFKLELYVGNCLVHSRRIGYRPTEWEETMPEFDKDGVILSGVQVARRATKKPGTIAFDLSSFDFFNRQITEYKYPILQNGLTGYLTLHRVYLIGFFIRLLQRYVVRTHTDGWCDGDCLYFGRQLYRVQPSDKYLAMEFRYSGLHLGLDPWSEDINILTQHLDVRGSAARKTVPKREPNSDAVVAP